ncbi:HET-domain-containing protein, partial [Glonium stellatum]
MIKGCQEAHQHPPLSDSTRRSTHVDLILVDVVDYQLVRRTSKDRFLALSYVRGSREALTTTMKNISSLEHPGALSQHGHEIPRLVQDAMEFVRRIGERYMWVDSLCIEHDNLSQKNDRISQMDIIYQQAVATIIALSAPDATA